MPIESVCKMHVSPVAGENQPRNERAVSKHEARMALEVAVGAGLLGTSALLAFYFGLLTLVSGWPFALSQFQDFGPFTIALAAGFGIQIGLYTYLRRALHAVHSGKVVAATGTTSGVAMVSCCTHYLVNLLPALGATGLVSLVGQYQIELFWFGLVANFAGIIFISHRLFSLLHAHAAKPGLAVSLLLSALIGLAALAVPASVGAQGAELAPQESKEGPVAVKVTPQTLSSSAKLWRFKLVFDTHSAALDQDVLSIAVLLADPAKDEAKPTAWDGNPPGGHHREGILTFKPISPTPASVTLKIRNVGGVPERSFTWKPVTP